MQRRTRVRSAYRFLRDFVRDEDGGPLVEFTVLMPIFFLIMFGIIEWGNIFFVENNMLISAREAARNWAVGQVTSPTTAINNACSSPFLTGANYTYKFTLSYYTGCTGASSPANTYGLVTMTITTPAIPVSVFNLFGKLSNNLNLSTSATLQEEFLCPAAANSSGPTTKSC
jgi:Flp pilus assembly protein TadG